MAWFKKEEAPEELKGLTPEQIAEAVKKSKEQETELANLRTKQTELERKASEVDSVKARIAEMEASLRKDNPPKRTEPTSVLVDEDTAFRERLGPTHAAITNTAASVAKMEARGGLKAKDRYIWDKYLGEIETLMANDPRRVQAAGWTSALTYIKGLHTDEITKPDFFAESSYEGEVGRAPEPTKKDDKLSDEELDVCKRMGVSPEDYLKQKKEMQVVNA